MKRTGITCLPYKIAVFALLLTGLITYFYYAFGCKRVTALTLSESVKVVIEHHTDKPGGEFISRSVDVFVNGRRIRRMWCSPMPSNSGGTGCFVALCRGEAGKYVAVRDQSAFWILSLENPSEVHTTFPEKRPLSMEAEFNVTDTGHVVSMPAQFSYWIESLDQKRSLLDQ